MMSLDTGLEFLMEIVDDFGFYYRNKVGFVPRKTVNRICEQN